MTFPKCSESTRANSSIARRIRAAPKTGRPFASSTRLRIWWSISTNWALCAPQGYGAEHRGPAGGDADEPYAEDHDCSGIARSVNSMRKKLDENDKGYVKKGDKNPDGNPDRSEQDDDAKSLDAKSTHEDEDGDNDGEDIDAKVKTLRAPHVRSLRLGLQNAWSLERPDRGLR